MNDPLFLDMVVGGLIAAAVLAADGWPIFSY